MTQTKIYLKGVLLLCTLFGNLHLANGQNKKAQIEKLLNTYAEYGLFSGSVLVAEDGGLLYKNGFGLANIEWRMSNTAQTRFRIGSITKQFTSMLVMQLVEEGKLDLKTPISTYLPDYPKENGSIITIHHLLSHTSGIPNFTSLPEYREYMRKQMSPSALVQTFADLELEFTPGEQYNYSNSGYVLLGYILETVAQDSYKNLLQDRIFTPLGMKNSGYDNHNTIIPNRATGYFTTITKARNADFVDMTVPYAAGAIYSTVEDLFLWDRALYTNKLLTQKFRDQLFTSHISAGRFDYGYGWAVGNVPIGASGETAFVVHHSGGINGFTSLITRFTKDDHFIVLTANTATDMLEEITNSIALILYDQPVMAPKKSFAREISTWMNEKKPKEVLKLYRKNANGTEFRPLNEFEMNQLGYDYLGSGQMQQALTIFQINIEAFPSSFNVYDSYAEALLMSGNMKESIKNYQKSLEINPDNRNGIQMLKRMGVEVEAKNPPTIQVDTELLMKYVGTYQLMPTFIIEITVEGQKIFGQATGQPKLELFSKSTTEFYSKMVDAQVIFNTDSGNGAIESLTLVQGGSKSIAKKVK
ncbi:MAG: serine hydrolase [Ekhidna sp.]